jgi:ferrous iron transport protein B
MSCSARLPIYVLFTGIFFGKNAGLAIFIIYITGIILAAVISILLKKFFFKKNEIPFVMELPPYRIPTMRNMFKHMWFKAKQYLKRMSTIILISSIIIWSLSYFPTSLYVNDKIQKIEKILENPNIKDNQKKNLEKTLSYLQKYQIENSYIGQIGKKIEPIMQPLGFDWKISISLITGIAGKEVVISTLSVLFNEKTNDSSSLKDILPKAKNKYGETLFTLPVVAAFLTFVLIYFPCIGVIATIKKETSKWKWSLYVITASLIIAYILSLGFKHLFSIITGIVFVI